MKFSNLAKLSLVFVISAALIGGCSSDKNSTNTSQSSTDTVDFSKDSEEKNLNSQLAEKYGLKDVQSVRIHYMNYNSTDYGEQKIDNKPVSQYLIFEKNLSVSGLNTVNQILDSISNNVKENRDSHFDEIPHIDAELKKIKEGRLSAPKESIKKLAGYSVYPDMKVVTPDKFNPYISLKDSKGKTVEIPFLMDALGTYIKKDGKVYALSESSSNFLDNILQQKSVDGEIPSDLYEIAEKNGLKPAFKTSGEVTLPDKFKEDVFGDGFNLFWENVNDIIKTDSSTKDGLDNFRGKKVKLEKYYVKDGKIQGLKRENSVLKPAKDKWLSTDLWLIALRDSDNRLIGEFLTASSQSPIPNARIDGKTLFQITGKTYYQWLDNAFEETPQLKEIASLSGEDLVKKYYSMLNSRDIHSGSLYVPEVSSAKGKVFPDSSGNKMNMEDYIDNIEMAKLLKISKNDSEYKLHPDAESYHVEVDFKYKEIIVNENGIDTPSVDVVKIGKNLGYRILEIGY